MSSKRRLDDRAERDGSASSNDEEPVDPTTLKASDEVMRQRRVVRAVRTTTTPAASAASTGLFKQVSSAPAPTAPALNTQFFSGATFASPFGTNSKAPAAAAATTTPAPASAPASAPVAATSGSTTASEASPADPKAPATTVPASTSAAPPQASQLFGKSFSFQNAANVFAEAKKRVEVKEKSPPAEDDTEATEENGNGDAKEENQTDSGFSGQHVADTDNEVTIASTAGKLSMFVKEEKAWHGRGNGSVKLIKHQLDTTGASGEKEIVYRLLVRDGYSLSTVVDKKRFLLTTVAPDHIIFSAADSEGAFHVYLLRYDATVGPTKRQEFTAAVQKVLAESESTSATSTDK